jgi:DNA-binding CsgD family transcriptional regulator
VRCFSEGLAKLHAVPDRGALSAASADLVRGLFPETSSAGQKVWLGLLATAAVLPVLAMPAGLGECLELELLWFHLVDCHARLRGEVGPPVAEAPALPGLGRLTARERQVIAGVRLGQTDAMIAQALAISPKTVGKHIEHILEKLGVETRASAVAAVYGAGSR